MKQSLLDELRRLARGRCDYCRMPDVIDPLPFQVDHIIAVQHGGKTSLEKLRMELFALQQTQRAEYCGH